MFLDDDQLRKLTGFAHKGRQVEQLRKMGIPFWINARGQAVVACSAIDGSGKAEKPKPKPDLTPYVLRRA